MTQRLYYDDAYTTEFDASVVERLEENDRPVVILDRTYFYPTSGGQPADRGTLNGVPVLDVLIRDADGAVLHVLERPVEQERVTGRIDWARRFDHMQQHTGQHILSQAFIRVAGAQTVGFHLSGEYCTIDLDREQLEDDRVAAAERMANEIIWTNQAISIDYLEPGSAAAGDLRKIPDVDAEQLRVVAIGTFDRTACGGTHVTRSGEIGMIKVVKTERQRRRQRVTFLCGGRALADYGDKNDIALGLAARLTVGYREVEDAVARLQDEVRAVNRQLRREQRAVLEMRAQALLAESRVRGPWRIVRVVLEDGDPGRLRQLAGILTREINVVALLATAGAGRSHLVLARAEGAAGAMQTLIKPALAILDSTSGGGSPAIAQGSAPITDKERLLQALEHAETLLAEQLS